jgi:hypothetical protein
VNEELKTLRAFLFQSQRSLDGDDFLGSKFLSCHDPGAFLVQILSQILDRFGPARSYSPSLHEMIQKLIVLYGLRLFGFEGSGTVEYPPFLKNEHS